MPISDPGIYRQYGFTLVEILIVLLVVGVATAVVAANISPDNRQAAKMEAARLADLLEATTEDAQDRLQTIAWSERNNAYSFWRKAEDGSWQPITDDDLYRNRVLGNGVGFVQVKVGGALLPEGGRMVFHPSGVNRPFEITLERNGSRSVISSDALNRISVR